MSVFTAAERSYLGRQPIGRIATATETGEPDVAPVTYTLDGDEFVIGGMDITRTLKHRNVLRNGQAALVVDDLVSRAPWQPRGLKVRGPAWIDDAGPQPVIRISPETIWSWGLNTGAETRFGPIEKRSA
jgi:pyridoxamine 5'-phosphate oxidase family protein